MIKKRLILLLLLTAGAGFVSTGCAEEDIAEHVTMAWGIPEEVTAFEELERDPQGMEVELVGEDLLRVTWQIGESYILPISATADRELSGVRYLGSGIPDHLELEWLDPREGLWYPLEEIPAEKVRVMIEKENDHLSIDFGPPQGADFKEGLTRLIWFRVTPAVAGVVEFTIYGYQMDKEKDPADTRLSNTLSLQGEVRP